MEMLHKRLFYDILVYMTYTDFLSGRKETTGKEGVDLSALAAVGVIGGLTIVAVVIVVAAVVAVVAGAFNSIKDEEVGE